VLPVCSVAVCDDLAVMRITEVKTFLVSATHPESGTEGVTSRHWDSRNWCFVKILTDEGTYGVGEASGWPRVVQCAITDLTPLLLDEDPMLIERLWHKMLTSMMGHGMLGVVGHGALTGIEMALWDLKGKALNVPLWQLLGGKMRSRVHCYAHSSTVEGAQRLIQRGYDAIKIGGGQNCLQNVVSKPSNRQLRPVAFPIPSG
jgi:galactonate dehydratase